MALFDFTGSIDVPDKNTKTAENDNAETSDEKESNSIIVIDNKEENIQQDNKTLSSSEKEETKNSINESTDIILNKDNSNKIYPQETEKKTTPIKLEKTVNNSAPVNLEKNDLSSVRISGIIFFDDEVDSIYHKYSLGINNIILKLYGENNEMIAKTVTRTFMRSSGYFEFANVKPGKYKIAISIPEDMFISPQNLRKYYGSKALRYKKAVILDIGSNDVSNVFIGLYK